jgi:hypothetical protein
LASTSMPFCINTHKYWGDGGTFGQGLENIFSSLWKTFYSLHVVLCWKGIVFSIHDMCLNRKIKSQLYVINIYLWRSIMWGTSRKVAGSIPDCVTGIFHWHNPSGRVMVLGLTQPLTEMSFARGCGPTRAMASYSRGFLITHNEEPQSVGLLWRSNQLVAETNRN